MIGRISGGDDRRILLATLGVAVVLDNLALVVFTGDTRTIDTPYAFAVVEVGPLLLSVPKLISFAVALALAAVLWVFMTRTDLGRAIRAVAREPDGARLAGISPPRIFALSYGIGVACLGAAACLLLPTFYVSPQVGNAFVLIAFTIVVLGGMGSFPGAVVGGLLVGVTESLGGLFLGELLGPIGIPLVFIAALFLAPYRPVPCGTMRHWPILLAIAFALAPFAVPSQFFVNLAMLTAFSALLGQSWNIAGGFGD